MDKKEGGKEREADGCGRMRGHLSVIYLSCEGTSHPPFLLHSTLISHQLPTSSPISSLFSLQIKTFLKADVDVSEEEICPQDTERLEVSVPGVETGKGVTMGHDSSV